MRSVKYLRFIFICLAIAGILIFLQSSKTIGSQQNSNQECLENNDSSTEPGSNVLWDNLSRQFVSF